MVLKQLPERVCRVLVENGKRRAVPAALPRDVIARPPEATAPRRGAVHLGGHELRHAEASGLADYPAGSSEPPLDILLDRGELPLPLL
jgi:hypothetical protein